MGFGEFEDTVTQVQKGRYKKPKPKRVSTGHPLTNE